MHRIRLILSKQVKEISHLGSLSVARELNLQEVCHIGMHKYAAIKYSYKFVQLWGKGMNCFFRRMVNNSWIGHHIVSYDGFHDNMC